ncbi:MAG: hypothetical protein OXG49_18115 [Chloroflexi bacterium]|nr:hypothetical protein [Chloroflexota bacterium]
MKRFALLLRDHWRILVIGPMAIVVMTWPTFAYIFDTGAFWLPAAAGNDIYMLFWDGWYSSLFLSGQADLYFTDLKFYPPGVSLAFHNFSLPHMFLFGGLSTVLPRSSAFNLTYLLLVFATMLAGYLYFQYLLRDRWLSFFGAMVFGASAFVISRPAIPYMSFIATLPLSLYFLHRGFAEDRVKFLILSAALIGLTAFAGLYMLVCLLITVALYTLCFARARWRRSSFWIYILILILIVGVISTIRILPMLSDPEGLSSALQKNVSAERGKDLLGFFVNYENPVTSPLLKSVFDSEIIENGRRQTVYLGYLPLLLIAFGLANAGLRSRIWLWLALSLIFLLLRLGSTLMINDVEYEAIRLPKYYLAQVFPQVFEPFWNPDLFFSGAVFPFALLACFGMKALLKRLPAKRHVAFILIAAGIVAFEYYQAPDPLLIPDAQMAFLSQLRQEDDQDPIRLINLPMGPRESKIYDFYQSYNGFPHVEGRPTRAPASAFDYIESNLLLSSWRRHEFILCLPWIRDSYLAGLQQLQTDGFTHVVYHHHLDWRDSIPMSFAGVQPTYDDSYVTVYQLAQLEDSCRPETLAAPVPFSYLQRLALASALIPDEGMTILSFHPSERIGAEDYYFWDSVFRDWKGFVHVHQRNGELQLQSSNPDDTDLNKLLSENLLFLTAYNPSQVASNDLRALDEAFAEKFQSCQPIIDRPDLVALHYLPNNFECALVLASDPFIVDYENGVRLRHRRLELVGAELTLETWWTKLPEDAHGVSIQVFNRDGAKVAGSDFTIRHDSLSRHRLDLPPLEPGDYSVKLILYHYETRASVAGIVVSAQSRFGRELEIGSIPIE